MAMVEAAVWEEDGWELCIDDGFVYNRRKRRRREEDSTTSGVADPRAGLRQRKKKTLMKLRDQYQREIDLWEPLSNTLRVMEERIQHQQLSPSSLGSSMESALPLQVPEQGFRPLVDELLFQAEAQEGLIHDLLNLCDAAEAMCKAEKEFWKQSLIDLPVWATPRGLLASLSDEDSCNNNDDDTKIT